MTGRARLRINRARPDVERPVQRKVDVCHTLSGQLPYRFDEPITLDLMDVIERHHAPFGN
jgi:hypothetical protein